MSGNSIGKSFVLTCFGESHGRCVGVVVDGCPHGIQLTATDIQAEVNKRRPISDKISTSRKEEDKVEILSGVFNNYTTGAPICMIVWNKEVDSSAYDELRWKPRPGHADLVALLRYNDFNDYRGGGRFSGRITVAFVMAGAVAKKVLERIGVEVLAYTLEVAGIGLNSTPTIEDIRNNVYRNAMRCTNPAVAREMEIAVLNAREEGDSVGGIIECQVLNFPGGVGDPIFDSLDAELARILFDIPAVKGVEFGAGFGASRLKGSENNDQYSLKEGNIVTLKNNAGGILGGLSNGMPIVVRVGFKPTPSISKMQKTVDLKDRIEVPIEIRGRHDACIVPRAVPVVESAVEIVLVDHLLRLCLVKRAFDENE
ncbi:MAG: chorismate synthase [Candidatus Bathyarchaeota archaeon]